MAQAKPVLIAPPARLIVSLSAGLVAGGLFLFSVSSLSAQSGRYTMTPTKDGVLRLDTRTGSVALCSRTTGDWQCRPVESSERESQERIRQLEEENARLRARLEERRLAPAPREEGKLEIPSEEEVDKAMDFMERLLQRFKGMVEDLNKEKKKEDGVPL